MSRLLKRTIRKGLGLSSKPTSLEGLQPEAQARLDATFKVMREFNEHKAQCRQDAFYRMFLPPSKDDWLAGMCGPRKAGDGRRMDFAAFRKFVLA